MKLVEVVSGLATSQDVAQCVHATATQWGKHAVYAKSTPGFIVNRVARPFYAEGLRVLQEGAADIATIDATLRECGGFRMGPFELMDLIGHDVNYAVTNSVYAAYYNDQRFLPSLIQKELIEAGRLGRKSKIGFYDYADTAPPVHVSTARSIDIVPAGVRVTGNVTPIASLVTALKKSSLSATIDENDGTSAMIQVGAATLMLTDGQFASVKSQQSGIANLIFFDLALNYVTAKRIVLAKAAQASEQALNDAIAFFQALGKEVSVIKDVAGLIVMRTLAMLANEGADAVFQQVCSIEDVDTAMKGGVNYPKGPMEWADEIGIDTIYTTLKGLSQTYGEDRYRMSALIIKAHALASNFYSLKDKD